MNTSRELTSYLKGIAILTVVGGHFSGRFMPYEIPFFGNHFIAFFFILSGVGLYFSLGTRNANDTSLFAFYVKRFIRIYPLYWVNFSLDMLFDPAQSISFDTIYDFFLIHFTAPPRLWFLHALIPCYVFAPAIYSVVKRYDLRSIPIFVALFIGINFVLHLFSAPNVRCWTYRDIYFSQYLLFCIGMTFPVIFKRIGAIDSYLLRISVFVVMLLSFIFTNDHVNLETIPGNNSLLFRYLFVLSTLLFSYLFINSLAIRLPLKRTLCLIGSYTYSIYLFEGMYATALAKVGILHGKSYTNALLFILFFPVFFVLCIVLEEFFGCKFNARKTAANVKQRLLPTS